MMHRRTVVATGIGIEVPGLPDTAALLAAPASRQFPAPFNPADTLGRKGLRYKDRATQLALCAAKGALEDARLPVMAQEQRSPETFGVVVSSNLGNLDTVCRVVETIHAGHVRDTSPLDLPNASSNVIASSLAIRFGCKHLNLTLCNGATSGCEALYLAATAIRARRVQRVLVVGVEPVTPPVIALMQASGQAWLGPGADVRLGEGAAAILLEEEGAAYERQASVYGIVGGYGYTPDMEMTSTVHKATHGQAAQTTLWLTPNVAYPRTAAAVTRTLEAIWPTSPPQCLDLASVLGETYGALGVFQGIAACLWLRQYGGGSVVATAGATWSDGCACVHIYSGEQDA